MNLLLLAADEIQEDGTALLRGRRAEHIATVLAAAPGQSLRAGIVDGPLGTAEVLAIAPDSVRVRVRCTQEGPAADDVLLLAVPRPKVLRRLLEHAAALGFGRIILFRTWRVDRSHLQSRALHPEEQRAHLLQGLEQAGRTRLPRLALHLRFRPFVEDVLPALELPAQRFCAHPAAATATATLRLGTGQPFALALGPEGGFLPHEVGALAERGFLPVRAGPWPLRTESALSVLFGQLDLLRQRAGATDRGDR